MKKMLCVIAVLLAAFFTVSLIGACVSPPPPPPPSPPPAAPPPPPPPEPEEEPEVDPNPHAGPNIQLSLNPEMFSPDGDGVDDELNVTIKVTHTAPIAGWQIEISEPMSPLVQFSMWRDEGDPSGTLTWDGKSTSGELVQSASEYQFVITVSDIYGNTTSQQGKIMVDVLVRREGDVLRAIVPSIVFPANSANLNLITDPEIKENNERILHRIAEVLNKEEFITYRVTVEGHANPTTPPNTRQRTAEETGTSREIGLRPLSETRATSVVAYLVELGVDKERLTATGMGGTRTLVEFADRDNWWKNRRVEFILQK